MNKSVNYPHLDAAVMTGLTCVEQGLESKRTARDSILDYVEAHYIKAECTSRPEDIPVSILDRLHDTFGFAFEAHGGKLSVRLPA